MKLEKKHWKHPHTQAWLNLESHYEKSSNLWMGQMCEKREMNSKFKGALMSWKFPARFSKESFESCGILHAPKIDSWRDPGYHQWEKLIRISDGPSPQIQCHPLLGWSKNQLMATFNYLWITRTSWSWWYPWCPSPTMSPMHTNTWP